jgi:hypothetical protein
MTVLCIAGDPGGARALSPVVSELIQRGAVVQLFGYRQGALVLREHGLPVKMCDSTVAQLAGEHLLAAQTDVLLTATSMNGEDFEKNFIRAARECHIASLSILDFWSNYLGRFSSIGTQGPLDSLPDLIAVMDPYARAEMISLGFPDERLVITGQPAYDELLRSNCPSNSRTQIRSFFGVGAEDRLLIYASQPFTEIAADSGIPAVPYDEIECLTFLLSALQGKKDFKIWVRPHPRETALKFQAFQSLQVFISPDYDRVSAIQAADGVIGMTSNFLLEAALLGKPTLSLQPRERLPSPLPLTRLGLGEIITDTAAISDSVERWLARCHNPSARESPSIESPFSPNAASRVADVLMHRARYIKC